MTSGIEKFVRDERLEGIPRTTVETADYGLRAIISQMVQHSHRRRCVPREFRSFFEPVLQLLEISQLPVLIDDTGVHSIQFPGCGAHPSRDPVHEHD